MIGMGASICGKFAPIFPITEDTMHTNGDDP